MPKRKKSRYKSQPDLDTFSKKRPRGRPGVRASEIAGRSYHFRLLFGQLWDTVGGTLVQSQTEEEVLSSLDLAGRYYKDQFARPGIPPLILKILRDRKFPKRRQARVNFIADSLAAWGMVSPRRSRDICERERNKKVNYITRQDYYIECTCRYKGPALHGRCPKCGTDKLNLPYFLLESANRLRFS
jgi:hypothetical protein